MQTIKQFKIETVSKNIEARKLEIAGYEIDIFNYEFILENAKDEILKASVADGLAANRVEINKVIVVLQALEAQLKWLESLPD